jgi:PAS domain S-box-containing protein
MFCSQSDNPGKAACKASFMDIKRTFTQSPFRRKFLFLLLVIFLPALGVIVVSGLNQRRDAILKAQHNASLMAQSLAAQQHLVANSIETMLSVLAQLSVVHNLDARACNDLFKELSRRYPFYSTISAATPDGNLFASSEPFQPGVNLSDRKHIRDVMRTLDFSAGEYIIGRVSKVNSLNFTYPVLNAQKKPVAILIAGINLNEYDRFITTVRLPEGSAVVYTDHKGIRLFRLPENEATVIGKPVAKGYFDAISGKAEEGLFEWTALDGVNRINAFKRLRLKANLPPYMYIVVGLPKDTILHEANLIMLRNLAILGITILLAMSLAWVFGNLVLISPINRLVAATQRFGMGEMEARTGLPHGPDELGRLAQAFDDMASLLETKNIERKRAEDSLNKAYAEMEARVQERTAELTASTAVLRLEISDRKRAEEALRQERDFIAALLQTLGALVIVLDRAGRVVRFNRACEQASGYTFQEVEGKPIFDLLLLPEEAEATKMVFQNLTFGKSPCVHENHWVARDGERRLFSWSNTALTDDQGRVLYVIGTGIDITERRQAEEIVKESLRLRQQILDTIPSPIFYKGTDCRYQGVNQAFLQFFGKAIEQVLGKTVHEVFSQEMADTYFQADQDLFQHPGTQVYEVYTYDGQGQRREMVVHEATFVDKGGALAGLAGIMIDITDRKKAERERLHFSKLESLATLAGGIAHDFNNILTAIIGNISLAMLDHQMEGESRERLTEAERACLQARNLSRQLLTFSKGGAPIKELVSVKKLVTESASFACRGSQVNYESSLPDNLWTVEADPGQIGQVFQNLVINAIQAMPTGGLIKIRGENLEVAAGSELPLETGRYVKISIQDEGIGISAELLPRIFEPYFTTKQKGSGLGLATSYSIIKNHNGHISVESELGIGTMFKVYLPASDQKVIQQPEEERELLPGNGKILVMDDEAMVREVLGNMLLSLGYEVKYAEDGAKAIELFSQSKKSGDPFAAVILDLTVTGGKGGKETIENLLIIDPQIKAIVSSGYSDDPIMADFQTYGFAAVIAKPYKISELSKVLNETLTGNK